MIRKPPGTAWCATLALLIALAMPTLASEQPQDFSQQLPLSVNGEGPWYRLSIPMQVQLAAQHPDLRDLRVFNAAGESLAYALTAGQARREHTLTSHTVRSFPLYAPGKQGVPVIDVRIQRDTRGTIIEVISDKSANGSPADAIRTGWLLDGSAIDAPLERLVLDSEDLEGFQRFSIEASDDLQQWHSWGEGRIAQVRYDGEQLEQREVRLPGKQARYLRLTWLDRQQAPALHSVQLSSGSTTHRPAPLIWSQSMTPRSSGAHEYVWELPQMLPVERLRIPLTQDNLLLPVTVHARTDSAHKWRRLTRGLLYRVTRQDQTLLQEELDLPGWSRVKELKLLVNPKGGGFGSQIPQLQFGMRGTELVFLARGDGPYLLTVGKDGTKSAALPLATLMPGTQDRDLDKLAQATLLPAAADAATPTTPTSAGPDWKRVGLWAVLLSGVLILVLMAWSLLRSRKPKDE